MSKLATTVETKVEIGPKTQAQLDDQVTQLRERCLDQR